MMRTRTTRTEAAARREPGIVVLIVATGMVLLLVMASFAIDAAAWQHRGDDAQRTADNMSLAAVAELVRAEKETGNRSTAEASARAVALKLASENGFSPSSSVNLSVTFRRDAGGSDHALVKITDDDPARYFSRSLLDSVTVSRTSEAVMSTCQATCNQKIVATQTVTYVNTGVGGDGWQPVVAGDRIFNLYHHKSGSILMCVSKIENKICTVGGSSTFYPVSPYPSMATNYTPKLAAVGDKVYFVVQTNTSTGLGCWDGSTHGRCAGFSSPLQLAPYSGNGSNSNFTRIDGPEVVGHRLFMYGDDNRMYCYDLSAGAICSGYPKASGLSGVFDLQLSKSTSGYAGGVKTDGGIQFDMLVHPDGRIYTSLVRDDSSTRVGCWSTATDAPCSGPTVMSLGSGHVFLFFSYDTLGAINGVCGRAGSRGGGNGVGHSCVTLDGSPLTVPIPFPFSSGGDWTAGQQSATAVTSSGHTVTYFPIRKQNAAKCYDWTTKAACAIPPSNWDGTEDYAYWYDGTNCIYGLGHKGLLFSFGVDNGQIPCPGGSSSQDLFPCTCADGVTRRWTAIRLLDTTDLSNFTSFRVVVTLESGETFIDEDLVVTGRNEIDLSPLNSYPIPPTLANISLLLTAKSGQTAEAYSKESPSGVQLVSTSTPTLIE